MEEEILQQANKHLKETETTSDETDKPNVGKEMFESILYERDMQTSSEVKLVRNECVRNVQYEMLTKKSELPEKVISEGANVDHYPGSTLAFAGMSDGQMEPQSSSDDNGFGDKPKESRYLKRNSNDEMLVKQPEFEYGPRQRLIKQENQMAIKEIESVETECYARKEFSSQAEFELKDPCTINKSGSKRNSEEMAESSWQILSSSKNATKGMYAGVHEDRGKFTKII